MGWDIQGYLIPWNLSRIYHPTGYPIEILYHTSNAILVTRGSRTETVHFARLGFMTCLNINQPPMLGCQILSRDSSLLTTLSYVLYFLLIQNIRRVDPGILGRAFSPVLPR